MTKDPSLLLRKLRTKWQNIVNYQTPRMKIYSSLFFWKIRDIKHTAAYYGVSSA